MLRELPGVLIVGLAALYFMSTAAPIITSVPIVVLLGELLRPC